MRVLARVFLRVLALVFLDGPVFALVFLDGPVFALVFFGGPVVFAADAVRTVGTSFSCRETSIITALLYIYIVLYI